MFEYKGKLIRVIDGDTIDVELDYGFKLKQVVRLRLAHLDTAELNDKDPEQRNMALAAKRFVQEKLEGKDLLIRTLKTRTNKERQTFGRYVANVYFSDNIWRESSTHVNLNELLIKEGFAKRY